MGIETGWAHNVPAQDGGGGIDGPEPARGSVQMAAKGENERIIR